MRATRSTRGSTVRSTGAAAALLLLALTACTPDDGSTSDGGTTSGSSDGADGDQQDPDGGAGEDDPTPDVIATQVWLYDLPSDSARPSGEKTTAVVAGGDGTEHTTSTTQWLGCDGTVDVVDYDLNGKYRTLQGEVAMRDGTPTTIVADVTISSESGELARLDVSSDAGVPVELDVTGVQTVTITAVTQDRCGLSDESYLVLVNAFVR